MVHFELTNNMTAEEFLSALKRFINRRGMCRKIISDNQSTFKKAERILQLSFGDYVSRKLNSEAVQTFLAENCISWSYITERSPHRGAFYERLNRSLKEPLRKILGRARLNYTELYTVLTEIEASMNQRPLTYLGSDSRNLQAITPAYLAIGKALMTVPDIPEKADVNISKRFRHLQTLLKHFWKRWSSEYLPTLTKRTRWQTEFEVPKEGDVCLITEENISRPSWTLGRIIQAIRSKDGLVRTYKLKTASGVLTRPIQRLHLLEKDERITTEFRQENISSDEETSTEFRLENTSRGGQDVVANEKASETTKHTTRSGRKIRAPARYTN